jgi:hypothetical protein
MNSAGPNWARCLALPARPKGKSGRGMGTATGGHHAQCRQGSTASGGSPTSYGGRGGRGEQDSSKGNVLVKTSSSVAHREALPPVGRRRSSGVAVFLPVTALGSMAAMVLTSCCMLESSGSPSRRKPSRGGAHWGGGRRWRLCTILTKRRSPVAGGGSSAAS